jgi:hypothetical protein
MSIKSFGAGSKKNRGDFKVAGDDWPFFGVISVNTVEDIGFKWSTMRRVCAMTTTEMELKWCRVRGAHGTRVLYSTDPRVREWGEMVHQP